MNQQRLKVILPLAFVTAAIVVAVVLVQARPVAEREERTVEPPLVRVMTVHLRDQPIEIISQGTVRSHAETTIVAQVAGKIEAVAAGFEIGGTFRRGDALARLDRRDHESALAQAEASLAQARLRLTRESAEAQIAREEWNRMGGGPASPLVLREPQLAEARAALTAAEAAAAQARLNIERTIIRAPYDGVLLRKHADIGQFVGPGTPLALIAAADYAEVELPVSTADLEHVDVASSPRVVLRGSGAAAAWEGRVVRTAGQIDPVTRMLPLIVRVERPFEAHAGRPPLRIGEFVRATIEGATAASVIAIPRGALRGQNRVFVVDPGNRLRFRQIRVRRVTDREVLVDAGLTGGERVVLSALDAPVDGMAVRVTEESPDDGMRLVPAGETAP